MKFRKYFLGVFFITFFIGCIFVLFLKLREADETTFCPVYKVGGTQKQTDAKQFSSPIKTKFEPEIFDVSNYWEETQKYKIQLLEVGDGHRKEDVKAKSGEIWLGLYREKKNFYLRSEKIKVYRTTKPEYIEDSKTVEVNGKTEPIVLIGKAKNLRDGEVETLFSQPSEDEIGKLGEDISLLKSGSVREFNLGKRKYTLRVKQSVNKENRRFLALVLESGKTNQVIEYNLYFDETDYSGLQSEDYLGNLVWVGDLDGDGKLDLYLDYNTHEKGYERKLYLSSEAEKGKLIKKVAVYSPTGC